MRYLITSTHNPLRKIVWGLRHEGKGIGKRLRMEQDKINKEDTFFFNKEAADCDVKMAASKWNGEDKGNKNRTVKQEIEIQPVYPASILIFEVSFDKYKRIIRDITSSSANI